MSVELFIGLVTHPRTRFTDSAGPDGLVQKMSQALEKSGITCRVEVSDQDEYSEQLLSITNEVVADSIEAELDLEVQWAKYLHPQRFHPLLKLRMFVHRRIRSKKFLGRNSKAGTLMVRRLINIELAHLKLLNMAHELEAKWCLIVEDDAYTNDLPEVIESLVCFLEKTRMQSQPKYVNLSQSFNNSTLKIREMFRSGGSETSKCWPSANVLVAQRPITNTVCAVLYRDSFVTDLLREFKEIPLAPVVPIDWKLNHAILRMHKKSELGEADCWFIEPGPILQRSMHQS